MGGRGRAQVAGPHLPVLGAGRRRVNGRRRQRSAAAQPQPARTHAAGRVEVAGARCGCGAGLRERALTGDVAPEGVLQVLGQAFQGRGARHHRLQRKAGERHLRGTRQLRWGLGLGREITMEVCRAAAVVRHPFWEHGCTDAAPWSSPPGGRRPARKGPFHMQGASGGRRARTHHGQAAVLDLVHRVLGGVEADRVVGEGVDQARLRVGRWGGGLGGAVCGGGPGGGGA